MGGIRFGGRGGGGGVLEKNRKMGERPLHHAMPPHYGKPWI